MITRLISAVIGIILLVTVVMSGSIGILTLALTICALIGMYEFYKAFDFLKRPILVIAGGMMTIVIMLSSYIPQKIILAAFFVYVIMLACQLLYAHREFRFSEMAMAFFCIFYVPVSLLTIINVRQEEWGQYLIWISLGGAWATDSFAYFTGVLFGKHKLCPLISPKKTIEGSVGGVVLTVITGIIYGFCIRNFSGVPVNYIALGAICFICTIVSQIGDLTASVIKRERNIKDYGNIMPGHGGFIDRFDSTFFVAPAVYIFTQIFTIFG